MKKIIFLLFIGLFFTKGIKAQISDSYFPDIEPKENGKILCHLKYHNKIIIGGSSFIKAKYFPSVICVDTLGNTLWNTAINDSSSYTLVSSNGIYKLMDSGDGYVFALFDQAMTNEIWKIDGTTGMIVWKKQIPYSSYRHMINYDANKFIISYSTSTTSWGKKRIAFFSKLTGDTLCTKSIGIANQRYGLAIDSQKNIYYTNLDSIHKLNFNLPHNKMWSNAFPVAQINEYQGIYCDTLQNEVFYFGNNSASSWKSPKIVKVNSTTGAFISNFDVPVYSDAEFQDFSSTNNFLYVNWRHLTVGGGTYPYMITKYDKASGTASWHTNYSFVGYGIPASNLQSGNGSSALSIDLDNNDNVYATGYYGSSYWGIIKVNGASGNIIYEKTIIDDTIQDNNISYGAAACVINNQPYFVGNLQTSFGLNAERSKVAYVKLDASSGNTVFKKYFDGTYMFNARVIAIENYLQNQTLVLSQVGRVVNVEMRDSDKNLMWRKTLSKNYYLFGSNLSVSPNGEIYVSAYSAKEFNNSPYYSTMTDSIFIFKISGIGNQLSSTSFYVNQTKVSPTNLISDNSSAFIFYQKNYTSVFYRKYNGSTISAESSTSVNYVKLNPNLTPGTPTVFYKQNCLVEQNASIVRIAATGPSGCALYEIDKTTLALSVAAPLPVSKINAINSVYKLDPARTIICGRNFMNYGSIVCYNVNILDTIWTKVLNTGSSTQVIKGVADPQKNYFYTISSDSLNLVVRKVSVNNGNLIWTYTYNGQVSNQHDFPMDISYDDFRKKVVVCGFRTINNKRQSLTIILDTLGSALDTIIKVGSYAGNNEALCASTLYDGTEWIGGYVDNHPETGFISEIAGSFANVWPGDANSDGTADNLDVLELGLHFTQTGPARATTSNTWQSYFANNWTGTITNGENLNHADCNGDGIINDNDTLAIYNNYGMAHSFKPVQTTTVNPQLSIIPDQSAVVKGTWGTASIYLGGTTSPISNINGLAFTIDFDNTLIETNNVYIEYQNSFLDAGQNLDFRKMDFANGKIFTATTHTLNSNVSGFGKIATLHYQIKSTLTSAQVLNLGISQAKQSDASGVISPLTSGSGSLTATIDVGLAEFLNANVISVSPNPTSGSLTINSKTEVQKIEVVSIAGQVLLLEAPTSLNHQLHLENFANGIYFVNLYQNDRIVKREKIILNK
ncbi:MAG: hypothetical protein K0S26_1171 [Bacteroidota bacterium]|jgi:hypothetical protein|nr:hypothetical protein [Bacteroidota bacterium]